MARMKPFVNPLRMETRYQPGLVDHKSPPVPVAGTAIPQWELMVSDLESLLRVGESTLSSNGDPLGRGALVGEGLSNADSLEKG